MGTKYIDIKEFWSTGYLQELNRQFLHPLGLALEVLEHDDGSYTLGGVWDYREDPEGIVYGPDMIDVEKVARIAEIWNKKALQRKEAVGFVVQPPDEG